MPLRASLIALLALALTATCGVSSADAQKKKYRVKPYPNTGIVRRTPPKDFVPPKGVQLNSKHNPALYPAQRGTCGAPPCAGGNSHLGSRDIRNFQPRDIRSNQQRQYYQSPYAR